MTDDVKLRRAYRSTKRAEQVAQTRRAIEASAGVLFRRHGYAGTSMPVIATEADVAVETIYRANGVCQCEAFTKASTPHPCYHRGAGLIVERWRENAAIDAVALDGGLLSSV